MDSNDVIAPFVLKTYQMVNDPSLDNLIRWGAANNTFIVVEPLDFSQRLLPVNFKHNNFSSFVRQLNTYGFKKVDPDRWEFANEWFLKGQTHLLKNIVRKRQTLSRNFLTREEEDDRDEIATEIARLQQDQKAIEQELLGMNKRLEATERRPEQMMALLHKVADDPNILPRILHEKDRRLVDSKRQRVLIASSSSSQRPDAVSWPGTMAASGGGDGNCIDGSEVDYSSLGFSPEMEGRPPVEYPFSLFEGGF